MASGTFFVRDHGHEWCSMAVDSNICSQASNAFFVKYDRVVTVTAVLYIITTGSWQNVGWIPDRTTTRAHWRPMEHWWLSCDRYKTNEPFGEARITTDGYIQINTNKKNVWYRINGTWISNE